MGAFSITSASISDGCTRRRRDGSAARDRVSKPILFYKARSSSSRAAKAGAQLHVAPQDTSPNFSLEPPAVHREVTRDVRVDRRPGRREIRAYSRRSRATATSSAAKRFSTSKPKRAGT